MIKIITFSSSRHSEHFREDVKKISEGTETSAEGITIEKLNKHS